MNTYNRLKHVAQDTRMHESIRAAFYAIQYGAMQQVALSRMADALCGMHGLSAEVHSNAVVFYATTSRARQPACIMVSAPSTTPSPSAGLIINTASALIQVFEGDADDSDILADAGPYTSHWVETKGRMLLH